MGSSLFIVKEQATMILFLSLCIAMIVYLIAMWRINHQNVPQKFRTNEWVPPRSSFIHRCSLLEDVVGKKRTYFTQIRLDDADPFADLWYNFRMNGDKWEVESYAKGFSDKSKALAVLRYYREVEMKKARGLMLVDELGL